MSEERTRDNVPTHDELLTLLNARAEVAPWIHDVLDPNGGGLLYAIPVPKPWPETGVRLETFAALADARAYLQYHRTFWLRAPSPLSEPHLRTEKVRHFFAKPTGWDGIRQTWEPELLENWLVLNPWEPPRVYALTGGLWAVPADWVNEQPRLEVFSFQKSAADFLERQSRWWGRLQANQGKTP